MRDLLLSLVVALVGPWGGAAVWAAGGGDASGGASGGGGGGFERWFVLQLQGERAGWAQMVQSVDEAGVVVSESRMMIAMRRGPVSVEVEQAMRFVETVAGEPVEAWTRLKMGAMAMESSYRFTDEGIEVSGGQGGLQTRRMLPAIEGEWLPPAAAQRYVASRIAEGAETITLRTVDLSMGVQPVEATMRVLGDRNVEVFGRVVPAVAWEASLATMPGVVMREYVDADGRTLKTTVSVMPGMDIEMLAADEALAMSPVDPPELLASMLIEPAAGSVAMDDPRGLVRAVYEVSLREDARLESLSLPSVGYQRVEPVAGEGQDAAGVTRLRVVMDLREPVEVGEHDAPGAEHLSASAMVNHEDPVVRELLGRAIPPNVRLTRGGVAEALRAFVYGYVDEKSLDIGFATASEVARTREGDCTEHAVLLAALLRAAEIPSRTVTGLVYVDEFIGAERVFGGHMWTQAWIDEGDGRGGRWIDLDPTLPGQAFDAAHITLGVAALDDDTAGNELMRISPLLGSIEVRVVEVEAGVGSEAAGAR